MDLPPFSRPPSSRSTYGSSPYGGNPYATAPYPPTRKLPILVGLLAVLVALVGIFLLFVGLFGLLWGLGILHIYAGGLSNSVVGSLVIAGAFYFILGIVLLAVARGLWDTEAWALYTTAVVVVLLFVWAWLPPTDLFTVVLWGLLLAYLIAVRKHFA